MLPNAKENVIFASLGTGFVDGIRAFVSIHEVSASDFFVIKS